MKTTAIALGLTGLLLTFGSLDIVSAQPSQEWFAQRRIRERTFMGPNQSRRTERFETLMKLKLVEVLDLSPEQGDKFLPVFNQYRQKTQRLMRARGELMQGLARHVRSQMGNLEPDENPQELSERELKEHLAKLDEFRRQQESNREEFYQQTGRLLSTEQLARLVVFEEMFAREIVRNLPNP